MANRFKEIPLVGNLSPWQTYGLYAHGPYVLLAEDGTVESLAAAWPSPTSILGWDETLTNAGHPAGTEPVSSGVIYEVGIGIMSLSQEKEPVGVK